MKVTQDRKNSSGKGLRFSRKTSAFSDSDFYEPSVFRREIFLDFDQWQNIGEDQLPWYEYNQNTADRNKIDAFQRIIIPCLREIISSKLTFRQKEVITMYFINGKTQTYIARKLKISQPTVSQHLNGKKRNGKKIGGSIKRIKKIVHHLSSNQKSQQGHSYIMNTLAQLSNDGMSHRASTELIRSILKY